MKTVLLKTFTVKCMATLASCLTAVTLFTSLYWHWDVSTSLLWPGNVLKVAREARPLVDYYTCDSHSGAIKIPGQNKSYRSNAEERPIGRTMLLNRMTDDYCYCREEVPFYKTPPLSKETKNPCWRHASGTLQCIPYFYLIGFSKSATTDLFESLTWHPQILNTIKESHWFDYSRLLEHRKHLQNYTDLYWNAAARIQREISKKEYSKAVIGDATPCVSWFSLNWQCFQGNQDSPLEPVYTNADVLHTMLPTAKIIVMVRDPADRLYSRYNTWRGRLPHQAYRRPSPQAFHELCVRGVQLYKQCFKEKSIRHCAYNGTIYTQTLLRLQEGMYSVYLKDWLRVFPKNQVLLIQFEDYVPDRSKTVKAVCSFLGLDDPKESMLRKANKTDPRNQSSYKKIGKMLPETKALLDEFYKPFQTELQDLIQKGSIVLL